MYRIIPLYAAISICPTQKTIQRNRLLNTTQASVSLRKAAHDAAVTTLTAAGSMLSVEHFIRIEVLGNSQNSDVPRFACQGDVER